MSFIQNMADPISQSRKQGRARNFTGTEQIQGVNIFAICLDQIWANCETTSLLCGARLWSYLHRPDSLFIQIVLNLLIIDTVH